MDLQTGQAEARYAYLRGGSGAIISGLVWLTAAIVATRYGVNKGFVALFFGGMLIFPISQVVDKFVFKRPSLKSENPVNSIAVESLFPLLGGLFVAWLFLPYKPEYVFAVAAIVIGTRYFSFRSVFGDFSYWIFGAILTAIGLLSIILKQPHHEFVPYLVAIIEIIFGIGFIIKSPKQL